ncbi:sulfotransferase family protein [Roseibium sp.]|uniref:sulfotransferase family protein n=2 Tax=Roseibium sp. TaxID=1936156 RepID=UPI0032643B21
MLPVSEATRRRIKVSLSKRVIFAGQGYNTKNFFHRDSVAVFPELKLSFNRIKKSGNSSICLYFAKLCGYGDFDTPEDLKDRLLRPGLMSLPQLVELRSYHSLVVVRDPFERALSAFLDKVGGGVVPRFAGYAGYGQANPDGFLHFLRQVAENREDLNRHFWPQTRLMYKPVKSFSLVARLENLPEELPPFIRKISGIQVDGESFKSPHPVERRQKNKITAAKEKLNMFYGPATVDLVRRIYQDDFAQLGYSNDLTG